MVILGYRTAIAKGRRGLDLSGDLDVQGDLLLNLVFPLQGLITFGLLVALDTGFGGGGDIHKRLTSFTPAWHRLAA